MRAYSNGGQSWREVAMDYEAGAGEILFPRIPTQQQLELAFPNSTVRIANAALIAPAQNALDKSDVTIVRCYASGVAVPSAWKTYRSALRAIINGSDTTSVSLPSTPSYPEGT